MGAAHSGSSILSLRNSQHVPSKMQAPTKPAMMAAHGSSTCAPAVMDTKPTSTLLVTVSRSHALALKKPSIRPVSPPAAPDSVVHTAARPMTVADSIDVTTRTEPGLKPYQPNHRKHVPSTTRVAEWPGMSTGSPFESKRPMRGPTRIAPHMPEKPPTMCTTAEPAKSMKPQLSKGVPKVSSRQYPSQPGDDHTQCTTTG
mmetsp:Transcript_9779/g.21801  ORF Transcript_9779/g.21801 Transcript_9779/m.21801 type:complete len:200 (+) Transcript_9779:636-1235(+)